MKARRRAVEEEEEEEEEEEQQEERFEGRAARRGSGGSNRRRGGELGTGGKPSAREEDDEEEESDGDGQRADGDEDASTSGSDGGEDPINDKPHWQSEGDAMERELEAQLAEVPFEELELLRQDGRTGPSTFQRLASSMRKLPKKEDLKRANKNRPQELSSKRPVPRFREVISLPKVGQDPRFDDTVGQFDKDRQVSNQHVFRAQYKFLFDEQLPAEKQRLSAEMSKEKDPERRAELKEALQRINNQLKQEEQRRKQQTRLQEMKHKEKEAVKSGKRPYYPKKSELRKALLLDKYKELKENGKLDTYLAKRRKKNAAKDHRYVPYRSQKS
eukprot:jgi/Chlat1/4421/Chrsp29S04547